MVKTIVQFVFLVPALLLVAVAGSAVVVSLPATLPPIPSQDFTAVGNGVHTWRNEQFTETSSPPLIGQATAVKTARDYLLAHYGPTAEAAANNPSAASYLLYSQGGVLKDVPTWIVKYDTNASAIEKPSQCETAFIRGDGVVDWCVPVAMYVFIDAEHSEEYVMAERSRTELHYPDGRVVPVTGPQ